VYGSAFLTSSNWSWYRTAKAKVFPPYFSNICLLPEQRQRRGGLVQAISAQTALFTQSGLPADDAAKVAMASRS
jgi:hypothetical protein